MTYRIPLSLLFICSFLACTERAMPFELMQKQAALQLPLVLSLAEADSCKAIALNLSFANTKFLQARFVFKAFAEEKILNISDAERKFKKYLQEYVLQVGNSNGLDFLSGEDFVQEQALFKPQKLSSPSTYQALQSCLGLAEAWDSFLRSFALAQSEFVANQDRELLFFALQDDFLYIYRAVFYMQALCEEDIRFTGNCEDCEPTAETSYLSYWPKLEAHFIKITYN